MSLSTDLVVASVGGVAVGVVAYLAIGALRRHLTEVPADTALSFVAPYLAFVPAEQIGASGVLAVVTTGLLLAHRAPQLQTAPSRLSERINWSSVTFVLENAVFLLIGLQIAALLDDVGDGRPVAGAHALRRPRGARHVPGAAPGLDDPLHPRHARRGPRPGDRLRGALVGSWAGMRGVVTLAAALTLPPETPLRAELVVIALVVTVGTLLLQGTTLPMLARALDVRGPDPREDALDGGHRPRRDDGAGLRLIESDPEADPAAVAAIREQARAPASTAAGSASARSGRATTRRRARPRPGCAPR